MNGSHHDSKVGCSRLAVKIVDGLDVPQPGGREQFREVALARACELGFAIDGRVELPRGLPEQAERTLVAAVVPDARGDDAVPPRHAGHLGQSRDRVLHEVDDELREGGVELVVGERQVLRGGLQHLDARVARPGSRDEGSEGSTAATASGPSRATSSAVRAPGSAADVDDALAAPHSGEVRHLRREWRE